MNYEGDNGSPIRLRRCDLVVWYYQLGHLSSSPDAYPVPIWVGSELASRRRPTEAEVARALDWMGAEQVGGRLTVERIPDRNGRGVRVLTRS